jgi:intein-encoded DNA endonuclease-like protein
MEKSMQHIYSFPPKLYTNPVTGVSRISYHNVALASYLKERSAELLNDVPRMSLDLKREFIKSFFDDEGCIDYRPKRNLRRIRGYQKDTTILTLIQCLLSDFNINSTVILPNEVVITGKNDLQKFQKEIGFSKGVFINGNRTNSIWKKSLEKRAILKAAIESYRK